MEKLKGGWEKELKNLQAVEGKRDVLGAKQHQKLRADPGG